jgi:TrmH family RNA methyltransferase
MIITSAANPVIKHIRKLKDRKFRAESGQFFIEGTRIVIEALEIPEAVEKLIVAREFLRSESAIQAINNAKKSDVEILEVTAAVFESFSVKDGPQGLAAVGRQKWQELNDIQDNLSGLWLALYQIADPGNLGTLLRSLDGMGGKGIILLDNCTDPYDPASMRASMGAILSKPLVRSSSLDFIAWLERQPLPVIGTSDAAKDGYRSITYPKEMVLLMGSEREGLPANLMKVCAKVVSIPMLGKCDSLNLSVAASIILYEYQHQHPVQEKG